MFDTFVESTLLMFVAVDPISLVPIFAGLTAGLNKDQIKSVYLRASLVSLVVLTVFWLFGNAILDAMNISMDSFKIIGGLFLIVIAFQKDLENLGIIAMERIKNNFPISKRKEMLISILNNL